MLRIEQSLIQRLPWLAQFPLIRRPVAGMLERLADEKGFNRLLERAGSAEGFEFVDRDPRTARNSRTLRPRASWKTFRSDGPLLVVANHPLGMQDALVLLQLVGSVRTDVRVLGNDWLATVPPLSKLLLPVDVFGKGAASRLRGVYRALQNGEALIVFPAGEVSRVGAVACVTVAGRMASRGWPCAAAPVLPVHIAARNSATFYGVSMLAKPLGHGHAAARGSGAGP